MKNFFRKVAFGLKPEEKIPSDPLTWAQKQVETLPELNWKGKYILSEKELRKHWTKLRVEENTTLRKKFKNDEDRTTLIDQEQTNSQNGVIGVPAYIIDDGITLTGSQPVISIVKLLEHLNNS